jgi:hypothetical protein
VELSLEEGEGMVVQDEIADDGFEICGVCICSVVLRI